MLKYTSQQTSPGLYSTSTQLVLNSTNGFHNYIVLQEGSPQSELVSILNIQPKDEKRLMSNSSTGGVSKLNRYQFSQSSIQDQQYNCASQQLKFTIESTQHSVTQQMTDERQKNTIETSAFEVKIHRSQSMMISGTHYNPDRTKKSSLKKAKQQQPQYHSHRNDNQREVSHSQQSEQPIPSVSSASKRINERSSSTMNQLPQTNSFVHHQKNQSHSGQQTIASNIVNSPQVTQVKNEVTTPKNDMTISQIRKVKENGFVNAIAISTPKSIIVHKTVQQPINSLKQQDLEKYDGIWSKKFQELEVKFMSLFQETILCIIIEYKENQLLKQKVTFDDQKKEDNEHQHYMRLQEQFQDLNDKYKDILQIQKSLKKQMKQNQVVDQSTYYASVIQSKDIEIDNLKRQLSSNITNTSGTSDINKLEEQIKLYERKLQNLESSLKNKSQQQEQQQAEINQIKQENSNLKKELQEKEKVVIQLQSQIENQNSDINQLMNQNDFSPDTKIQKLKNQLSLWKDKFINLNRIQLFKKPNIKKLTFNI